MKHTLLLKTTLMAAIALVTMMGIAGCQWGHDDRDYHGDPHYDDQHHDDAHVDVHADDHSDDHQ